MNVLFGTDVIIDIVERREPFYDASNRAANHAIDGEVTGFVSVQSLKDVFCFVRKVKGEKRAFDIVERLSAIFMPLGVHSEDSLTALMSGSRDYKDALLNASAVRNGIDMILMRDREGFIESDLLIVPPEELDRYLESGVNSGGAVIG
ncbi:MAG: PIN domain-containing protein [Methanomassiliicoccaceae archaeon]|nr:PIN domain-containing protein [Methanomassiliicoccaceae archaeon]